MRNLCHAAGLLAALVIGPHPVAAAEDRRDLAASQARSAPFLGAAFSIPLGGSGTRAPTARLQLSPAYLSGAGPRAGTGIEFIIGKSGKPALAIAGRSTTEMERQLGFKRSTGTYIVVGGAVLLLLVVVAASSMAPPPGPSKGDF
jgi:hypothetical protein